MKKRVLLQGVTGLLLVCGAAAQGILPSPPKRLVTRPTGGGASGGVSIVTPDPSENPNVRHTTHLVLSESRQWTSVDGKTLQAKLLAFEDVVVDAPKGAQPAPPVPPASVTVVRAGKIRLVTAQKPFELALERLSQADREFVERIRAAQSKSAPAPSP